MSPSIYRLVCVNSAFPVLGREYALIQNELHIVYHLNVDNGNSDDDDSEQCAHSSMPVEFKIETVNAATGTESVSEIAREREMCKRRREFYNRRKQKPYSFHTV